MVKRGLLFLLILIGVSSGLSGCVTKTGGLSLHETPQVYVLHGETSMGLMPTVTLYENGNASLSQPLISSYALFGIGSYTVKGNELIVSHGSASGATFEISDGGDTLTLKSARIGFTKVGSVYKYRSNSEYLSQFHKVEGEKLTIDVLRKLVERGSDLSALDFAQYEHTDKDPDHHIYDIEGEYTLQVVTDADGHTTFVIEHNSSGETFPLHLNGSTGFVFDEFLDLAAVPKYETRKWFDFLADGEMPWGDSMDIMLPEFPEVSFTWTTEKVTDGEKDLLHGMPIWNVYLADLTNDGKPEFCATVSIGSGIIDMRVIVFDYVTGKEYQLSDRMNYDYSLAMKDGKLMVTQTDYRNRSPLATAELRLINGEIFRFGS